MYIADLSSVRYKYGVRGVSQTKFTMSDSFLDFYDFDKLFFLYKNIFYKNIEAEICEILRIF